MASPSRTQPVSLGLVGPGWDHPCGIADYVHSLRHAMEARIAVVFRDYVQALADSSLETCGALLVHYERSLVPDAGYMARLSRRFPGKVFVVPHEVYAEDPMAFPYAALQSRTRAGLWVKRLLYRWHHRAWAREKALERRGYHAAGVLPLSAPAADLLKKAGAENVLAPVPHAFWPRPAPSSSPGGEVLRVRDFLPQAPPVVAGVFGFLNPAHDYDLLLGLLGSTPGLGLLFLGDDRPGQRLRPRLEHDIRALGLKGRAAVTGYLPDARLGEALAMCDLFLCPFKFKSSSGSILRLVAGGKPVLAGDLPIIHYLKDQGAPLILYRHREELGALLRRAVAGTLPLFPNAYPWTFDRVAQEYLRRLHLPMGLSPRHRPEKAGARA